MALQWQPALANGRQHRRAVAWEDPSGYLLLLTFNPKRHIFLILMVSYIFTKKIYHLIL